MEDKIFSEHEKVIKFFHLGNFVGIFNRETKLFIKYRKQSDIFRKYNNGLAISYPILEKLRKLDCTNITILLTMENGNIRKLKTNLDNYLNNSHIHQQGQDFQRVLEISLMDEEEYKTPKVKSRHYKYFKPKISYQETRRNKTLNNY